MTRRSALLLLPAALYAAPPGQDAARRSAESWLSLVDAGKQDQSWRAASSSFRRTLNAAQWRQALEQVRGPLGTFRSRTFNFAQTVHDPPNVPPGDYFLLQYDCDFEYRRGAGEVLLLVRESRRWRVAGYFVK